MKLRELYELSPLGWEEAKRLTILENGKEYWERRVTEDNSICDCFYFSDSGNELMWVWLNLGNPTLLKEWEAKQIK